MNIPSTRNTQSTPSSSFQTWKTQSLDTSPRSGKCNRTFGRASGSALAFMLKTDTTYRHMLSKWLPDEESHFPKSPGVCCTSPIRLLLVDRANPNPYSEIAANTTE